MTALKVQLPRKHRRVAFAHCVAGHMKRSECSSACIPVRWRGLKGGRDSAKSHSFATAALVRGVSKPERILYVREVQKSLADSAHQLLCDKIASLGLQKQYTVQQQYIHGSNGTQFSFNGLSAETADSLKSKEGTTICVIQEAQSISARSLDILIPTIRASGSELWAEWNPDAENDAIDQRLVVNCPADAIVDHVNYTDNPWASKSLDSDREQMQRTDPDKFSHLYLGQYRPAVEGSIFYREVTALKASGRLCNVPYDPMLKVHWVWDLGFNDYMSILGVQRHASEVRVIVYIEDRLKTYDHYSQLLKGFNFNHGKLWLPHDARARSAESGRSAEDIMRQLGWDVQIVPDVGVEQGINLMRMLFPRLYVDKAKAGDWMSRMGRYRRHINKVTGTGSAPMHDEQSHGADAGRYLAVIADQLTNDTEVVIADPYADFRSRRHA